MLLLQSKPSSVNSSDYLRWPSFSVSSQTWIPLLWWVWRPLDSGHGCLRQRSTDASWPSSSRILSKASWCRQEPLKSSTMIFPSGQRLKQEEFQLLLNYSKSLITRSWTRQSPFSTKSRWQWYIQLPKLLFFSFIILSRVNNNNRWWEAEWTTHKSCKFLAILWVLNCVTSRSYCFSF